MPPPRPGAAPAASRPVSSTTTSPPSSDDPVTSTRSELPKSVRKGFFRRLVQRLFAQTQRSHEELATGNINKLILHMSVPNCISFGVTSLYAVVDSVFIGNAVGSDALAAFTIVTPVEKILCFGVALMISVGSAPLISRYLGKGDVEMASRILSIVIATGVSVSVIIPLCLIWFLEDILVFLGATAVTLGPALAYGRIILLGGLVTTIFSAGLNPLLRVENKARLSMWRMITSATINMAVDPVLLYGTRIGLPGAAISTIVAEFVTGLWGLLYIIHPRTSVTVRPRLRYMAPSRRNARLLAEIVAMGFGNFLSIVAQQAALILGNRYIRALAVPSQVEPMVAALGVGLNINLLIGMPLTGIMESYVPIAAFNLGAGLLERFFAAFRWIHVWVLAFGVALVAAVQALARPLANLYTNDADTVVWCQRTIRIISSAVWGFGAGNLTIGTFQSLRKAPLALLLSVLISLFYVFFIILLVETTRDPALLFWTYPISDLLFGVTGAAIDAALVVRLRRRVRRARRGTDDLCAPCATEVVPAEVDP